MAADDRDGVSALRNGVPPPPMPLPTPLKPAPGPAGPVRPTADGAESNEAEAARSEDARVDGSVDVTAAAATAGTTSVAADADDE